MIIVIPMTETISNDEKSHVNPEILYVHEASYTISV